MRGNREGVDDIQYLREVIDSVSVKVKIDRKRIYCTGFSNGASMTFYSGVKLSEVITAIAPVSGYLWVQRPELKRKMSVMLVAGEMDPLNPLEGGMGRNPWGFKRMKPPMMDSVRAWLAMLGIHEDKKTNKADSGVRKVCYGPDEKGNEVIFVVISGQGHEWPGAQRVLPLIVSGPSNHLFQATEEIWNFFKIRTK